ncbi:hypothetical protein Cgig2_014211 [Carnegiea gigantea]|uniref:Uncharacterized protein n=1 Tax=Carnegiea gigantea TaxID=171969 RepID=A0A9Q1GXC1_9CARY|nr:hypothetical protein Cgig2_014211 [Carnegiea gigantea]
MSATVIHMLFQTCPAFCFFCFSFCFLFFWALAGCKCSWMEESFSGRGNLSGYGRKKSHVYSLFPEKPAAVSSVEDLCEFICAGSLVGKTGLTPEKVAESIDKWLMCGSQLCRLFQLNELYLNDAQKVRIYHYYIPLFLWCEDQISQHASMFKDGEEVPPFVIGFSAPQGCGKTTLVFALNYLFHASGRKCATVSIDDFYLTFEDQVFPVVSSQQDFEIKFLSVLVYFSDAVACKCRLNYEKKTQGIDFWR